LKIVVTICPESLKVSSDQIQVEIPLTASWSDFVEDVAGRADDEGERFDDALFLVSSLFEDLEACFPGDSFAGFAGAPDDNSVSVLRPRDAQAIATARRQSAAFRALRDAGVDEPTIQTLATEVLKRSRSGELSLVFEGVDR
jgi:hypothetical protein